MPRCVETLLVAIEKMDEKSVIISSTSATETSISTSVKPASGWWACLFELGADLRVMIGSGSYSEAGRLSDPMG
jgi:hypothetical protein